MAAEQLEEIAEVSLGLSQAGPRSHTLDVLDQHFARFGRISFKLVVAEVESDFAWNLCSQVARIEVPRPQHIHVHFDVRDDALNLVLESLLGPLLGLNHLRQD